jgi:virginiamycin B lyase
MVWWAETRGLHLGRLNPKTGEMVRFKMDEKGELRNGQGHTPVVDFKQNIWFTVIIGNRLGKWDRESGKVNLWEPPTPISFPYGIDVDNDDKVWIAEFHGCKVAKFDPVTERWNEYPALTQPCTMRRMSVDSKGTPWYALFSSSKIGKIDPKTGKATEYALPLPFSEPYDIWPDRQDNMWTSDAANGGAIIKFDPRTEKFTYYPSPQPTDMPKFEITGDGAIWYAARSARKAAVGVLYPDMTKMKTLAAHD